MAQKIVKYNSIMKRSVEQLSAGRFVFWRMVSLLLLPFSINISSCGEPEIKLTRADKRTVDTLVNYQLDSISPILDSTCLANKDFLVQKIADSIILERKRKEERLRLKK